MKETRKEKEEDRNTKLLKRGDERKLKRDKYKTHG